MKTIKKRKISLILVFLMVFSMFPTTWGATSSHDLEDVFVDVHTTLTSVSNRGLDSELLDVLRAIKNNKSVIDNHITSNFDSSKIGKGFSASNIKGILNVLVNQQTLILNLMADDAEFVSYETDINTLINEIYAQLPSDFKSGLPTNAADKKEKLYILIHTMLNTSYGSVTYNTTTGVFSNIVLNIPDTLMDSFESTLGSDLGSTSGELLKLLFNAVNTNLSPSDKVTLVAILKELNLITVNEESSSSSSSSSTTTTTETTTSDDNKDEEVTEDADKVEEIINEIKENSSEEEREKVAEAIKKFVESVHEKVSESENADVLVKQVSETVKKALETLNADKGVELVKNQAELVNKALDNDKLSTEKTVEVVKDFITNNVAELAKKEDVNLKETKKTLTTVLENAVKKASTVQIEVDKDNKEIKITEDVINTAIENAIKTAEDLEVTVKNSNLNLKVEKIVNLKLQEAFKPNEKVKLELDPKVVEKLADSNVSVTVEAKGVEFKLPTELLKASKSGVKVESRNLDEKEVKMLPSKAQGGNTKSLKSMDLSVEKDGEKVKGSVELSFTLSDLENVDLDTLMVGVFEDGKWVKLGYEIKGNKVVFSAPHFSIYSLMKFSPTFKDINTNWASKYIVSLSAKGIVNGKDDLTFDPNGKVTRAEFAKLLVEYLGLSGEVKFNFLDVSKDAWYYDYVGLAGENGIASGASKGNFYPNEAITRDDMAAMLVKAYEIKNDVTLKASEELFKDDVSINNKEAVYKAKKLGLITGYANGTFMPERNLTRAEAVKAIYEMMKK